MQSVVNTKEVALEIIWEEQMLRMAMTGFGLGILKTNPKILLVGCRYPNYILCAYKILRKSKNNSYIINQMFKF